MRSAIEPKVIQVLRIVTGKLKGKNVSWVLIGSTSLALQGVDIKPKDVDILTSKGGAFEIGELLKEYEVEPVRLKKSELFESFFGEFNVNGIEVEVMGDMKEKVCDKWVSLSSRLVCPKIVEIEGMRIPVSSLLEQQKSYEQLGRRKDPVRVRKINEALRRAEENVD